MHRRGGPVSLDDGRSAARLAPAASDRSIDGTAGPVVSPVTGTAAGLAVFGAAAVAAVFGAGWAGLSVVLTVAALVPAAVADRQSGLLPSRLTRPGGVVAALSVIIAVVTHGAQPAGAAVAGAVAMAAPILGIHTANPGAMGFGDVRVAAVLGLSIGLVDWRLGLVALAVASALAIGTALRRGAGAVPFGPALLTGTLIAVVASSVASARGAELLGAGAPGWP